MLTANLLPPKEKRLIRAEQTRRIIIFFAAGTSAVFLVGSVLLMPSYLPLLLEKKELERSLALEKNTSENIGTENTLLNLRDIRQALSSVLTAVSESGRASAILGELFKDAGGGIRVTNISVKKNGSIIISGNAKTRQGLLSFEKILQESGRFENISSPLSNIIREVDLTFTIQGVLKTGL